MSVGTPATSTRQMTPSQATRTSRTSGAGTATGPPHGAATTGVTAVSPPSGAPTRTRTARPAPRWHGMPRRTARSRAAHVARQREGS